MKININILKEHPLNKEIYGSDNEEQLNELVERIRNSGYIKPILITKQYFIISGHRRVRAALQLGYTEIEFQFVPEDPQKQVELLLLENFYREKSMEQKTREAKYYMEIETRKSEERKRLAGIENLGQSPVVVKIPPLTEKGKTRDIVGQKYGMSGKIDT
jgi:ParB family chromosome partitioning protein